MANQTTGNDHSELELDDVEVSIMIIAKAPKALATAATFLSRRGWPTIVFSDLSQAVEYAGEKRPDFVLISVNHPSPTLGKVSDMLATNLGLTCVAFTEGHDTTSNSKLSKSRIALKIQGQASGPNIHRSIRRILAERLNITLEDKPIERLTEKKPVEASNSGRSDVGTLRHKPVVFIEGDEVETAEVADRKNKRSLKDLYAQAPVPQRKSVTQKAELRPEEKVESAVQTAIESICRPGLGQAKPIQMIEQVGVFPIDSPGSPGYLVLAWPGDSNRAQEAFFKLAQNVLHAMFTERDVPARLEPGFFVNLPPVEFLPWAVENASFHFTTSHGESEIGVAFFKTNQPIPKPRRIADKAMYSIGVEDIATNQPVTFKVYLHMKKNKKYFLYLRNGRQLQPEQKQRLEGNNVKDFYMKTIDVENLRMFLATAHLTQKIKKGGSAA